MILDDTEVDERVNSPDNLINRLRKITNINRRDQAQIPSMPPSADDIVKDLDEKLSNGSIKSKASKILISAMNEIETRIPEVDKPEKLARIAESMSKIIETHTPKKQEGPTVGQVIIYSPTLREEKEYPVIDIRRLEEASA